MLDLKNTSIQIITCIQILYNTTDLLRLQIADLRDRRDDQRVLGSEGIPEDRRSVYRRLRVPVALQDHVGRSVDLLADRHRQAVRRRSHRLHDERPRGARADLGHLLLDAVHVHGDRRRRRGQWRRHRRRPRQAPLVLPVGVFRAVLPGYGLLRTPVSERSETQWRRCRAGT